MEVVISSVHYLWGREYCTHWIVGSIGLRDCFLAMLEILNASSQNRTKAVRFIFVT
jgi:hypothetical protein